MEETNDEDNTVAVLEMDGIKVVKMPEIPNLRRHLENIRTLDLRPDDVIITAYARSGTHWTWETLSMLQKKSSEYSKMARDFFWFDGVPTADIDALPSPRVLSTHLLPRFMPDKVKEGKAKIVFVKRNPKDVLVSEYKLREDFTVQEDFQEFMQTFIDGETNYGGWFRHIKEWDEFFRAHPQVPAFYLDYEDMSEDPLKVTTELATFLGLELDEQLLKDIVSACQFQNMKSDNHNKIQFGPGLLLQKECAGYYRKGKVGGWKQYFTVAQNEAFDESLKKKLANTSFKFKYAL